MQSHRSLRRTSGLSLGLKEAGFDIIALVEIDSDAGATYRHNIGNHTEIEDITKFSAKKLRKKLLENGRLSEGESALLNCRRIRLARGSLDR